MFLHLRELLETSALWWKSFVLLIISFTFHILFLSFPPFFSRVVSLPLSLRPLDVEFMRRLSKVVNIVPVIAKADTLTLEERDFFKKKVTFFCLPFAFFVIDLCILLSHFFLFFTIKSTFIIEKHPPFGSHSTLPFLCGCGTVSSDWISSCGILWWCVGGSFLYSPLSLDSNKT